jgi:hypothetical protein
MQLCQPLLEDGMAVQYTFLRVFGVLLEQNLGVLNITWLSSEAYFSLDGCINKQNHTLSLRESKGTYYMQREL